jgi:head-tail adaptor
LKVETEMRAGTLDVRIALQRKATSYSIAGDPVDVWSTLVERWSAVDPVRGDERNAAQQWVAREQTKFTLRWSAAIDDFSPLDRVIFPADDAANSPISSRSTYDVIEVHQEGRNDKVVIMAARRVA